MTRKEVIKVLLQHSEHWKRLLTENICSKEEGLQTVEAFDMAIKALEQEPKTGHWIGDKAYPICSKCNCNIIEEYISCSDYAEMYKPMKCCPNCGAKMIEPQESEVQDADSN